MKIQLQFFSSNMISQKRQHVAMNMQLQFVFQQVITETTTSFNENVVVVCLATRNHKIDNKLQWICSCSLSSNMLSQKRQQVTKKMQLQFVFQYVITETTISCNGNVPVVCLSTCYHRNDKSCNENVVIVCLRTRYHRNDNKLQ